MSDFEIENGILVKYHGSGGEVIIPAGVTSIGNCAFLYCVNLTGITIPDGVTNIGTGAFEGCRNLTSIQIPDSMTNIGRVAFRGCSSLTSITIPDSVTSIGGSAFYGCTSLMSITIPDGTTRIGDSAFYGLTSLMSITIPDRVKSIGDSAFYGCTSLTSIKLPDSLTSIGYSAFYGCKSLTSITIPNSVTSIGDEAFSGCDALSAIDIKNPVFKLTSAHFRSDNDLSYLLRDAISYTDHLSDGLIKSILLNKTRWAQLTAEQKIRLFCEHQSKTLSSGYVSCMTPDDVNLIADALLTVLNGKPSTKDCAAVLNLIQQFTDGLTDDKLKELYNALKSAKGASRVLKKLEADDRIMKRINCAAPQMPLSPEEQIVADAMDKAGVFKINMEVRLKEYSLKYSDLPEIRSVGGQAEPPYLVAWLLTLHEMPHDGRLETGIYPRPGLFPEAQAIVSYLDQESLQQALIFLTDRYLGIRHSRKMYLAYPICRYADVNTMDELLKRAPKWRSSISGDEAPPLRTFRNACLYSTQRAVIPFADKYGDLERYAEIRSTTVQNVLDSQLLAFGLNADGQKTYDIGGTSLLVTLEKDFSFSIYDCGKKKSVKSIPKRGNDAALVEAAAAEFSELKKFVKKALKNCFNRLLALYLNGQEQPVSDWKNTYLNSPLQRNAANLIVWKQGSETFILNDSNAIHADGTAYAIADDILISVAHPMEMDADIRSAWQNYFVSNQLKQPFEQVWEPVVDPTSVQKDRYAGIRIPYYRFLHKDNHGIHTEDWYYHDDIEISFADCSATVCRRDQEEAHSISAKDCFEITEFAFKQYTRQVNHIVAYLDRITVASRIWKDDVTVVQFLDGFTLPQITEFIKIASDNKCVNVLALLLNWKETHFSDIDPMDEFTLDLL